MPPNKLSLHWDRFPELQKKCIDMRILLLSMTDATDEMMIDLLLSLLLFLGICVGIVLLAVRLIRYIFTRTNKK